MRYFKLFHESFGEFLAVQVKPTLLISLSHINSDIISVDQLLSASNLSNKTIDEIATNILDKSNNPLEVEISDIGFTVDNDADFQILRPFDPPEVWAAGVTYKSSEMERRRESETPDLYSEVYGADRPEIFLKSTSERCMGPLDDIGIRTDSTWDVPEAELGFVIFNGEVCGFTCGNDVSVRDWQQNDLQWWRAKSCDTFTVLGPWVETDFDPGEGQIQCRINDEVVQNQNISDLLHGVPRIIEFVSSLITLNPGDVIMTGTPGVPKDMFSGDTVEVEIEGLGILSNPVINE